MKGKIKITKQEKDYIKAVRKRSRDEEIVAHGKLITTRPGKIKRSKKAYTRKGGSSELPTDPELTK